VSRAERKAQTRQDLVDAAVTEFGRLGFQGARVERIAAVAGVTTGALYAHFGSKEELFLAVYEVAVGRAADEIAVLAGARDLAGAADAWLAWHAEDPRWTRLSAELLLAVPDLPQLRDDVLARRRQGRDRLADWLVAVAAQRGRRLTVPPAELALLVNALAVGMVLQQVGDPEAVVAGRFGRWVDAIVTQHTEPAGPTDPAEPEPGPPSPDQSSSP